ncbi:MAG: hypothetical protein ABFE16_05205 [Armatimonadia bacterium]
MASSKRKKSPASPEPSSLVWSVWPARQKPFAAAACVLLILGVSWYGYVGFGHLSYSIVALVVLTGSLAFFFFPSTYTLDAEGISVRGFLHGRSKRWEDLACYLRGDDFIALSTTAEPTERSISQGFLLRLDANTEEVVAFLSRHLPEWKVPRG